MKRTVTIGFTLLTILLVSPGTLNAQKKKNEQRIKIVVADKSGTAVKIDTLIKGDITPDSIKLKNGEVIYLARHKGAGTIKHIGNGKEDNFLTITSDDNEENGKNNIARKITVISGDSADIQLTGKDGDVIIVKNGNYIMEGKGGKVVTWSSSSASSSKKSKGESYVYISEDKDSGKSGEKSVNVKVTEGGKDNSVEMTKYVIAKDGIVVSVEGSDEKKVNDLAKDIELKLGVSKDDKNMKKVKEKIKTTKK
jgi:hypothetical protein